MQHVRLTATTISCQSKHVTHEMGRQHGTGRELTYLCCARIELALLYILDAFITRYFTPLLAHPRIVYTLFEFTALGGLTRLCPDATGAELEICLANEWLRRNERRHRQRDMEVWWNESGMKAEEKALRERKRRSKRVKSGPGGGCLALLTFPGKVWAGRPRVPATTQFDREAVVSSWRYQAAY